MEWVEHPLQTILLTVAEHIVIHKKKDAFDLLLQKRFLCNMKSDELWHKPHYLYN